MADVVYWPHRQLCSAVGKLHAEQPKAGKDAHVALHLMGFFAGENGVCVTEISTASSTSKRDVDAIGVCLPRGQPSAGLTARLVATFDPTADDIELSLRCTLSDGNSPLNIVLYDPHIMENAQHVEAADSAMQELCGYYAQCSSDSRGSSGLMMSVLEAVAYYSVLVPLAVVRALWLRLDAFLSVPMLAWLPVGGGSSIREYSHFLNVFNHRIMGALDLPSHVRHRYRHGNMKTDNEASYIAMLDFVLYLVVDYALGRVFCGVLVGSILPALSLTDPLSPAAFLDGIRSSVVWLMGAPAGFKLNVRLASILGNGILLWLDLWEFLLSSIVSSSLWQAVASSSQLQSLAALVWTHCGVSLQLCLIGDVLSVATWSSCWIYLYFYKLNKMQFGLLSSLWKLFLGKKNNVLRKRVDSCEYDVNQLLLGTLLFTILVFLVTTNAVFFVYFWIVRVAVLACGLLLWAPVVLLRSIPLASIVHRLVRPSQYTEALSLEVLDHQPLATFVLRDIGASRRRDRDAQDQDDMRAFLRKHVHVHSDQGMFFRIISRPSSISKVFYRLKAYHNELKRVQTGGSPAQSSLLAGSLPSVDLTTLFSSKECGGSHTNAPVKTKTE